MRYVDAIMLTVTLAVCHADYATADATLFAADAIRHAASICRFITLRHTPLLRCFFDFFDFFMLPARRPTSFLLYVIDYLLPCFSLPLTPPPYSPCCLMMMPCHAIRYFHAIFTLYFMIAAATAPALFHYYFRYAMFAAMMPPADAIMLAFIMLLILSLLMLMLCLPCFISCLRFRFA